MLTASLSMPWRFGVDAAFPFHDLARALVAQTPVGLELLFVAPADGASLLQLHVDFAPPRAELATRLIKRLLVMLEGEADFDCRFLEGKEARLDQRFTFLSVQPDVLALPSNKEFSVLVPLLDSAAASFRQARAQGIDAAYRVRMRPRRPDSAAARRMVPALAELVERAPLGATCAEAQRAFDMLRRPGWYAVEEIGVPRGSGDAPQPLIEGVLLDRLASQFGFVPAELWLPAWDAERDPASISTCRGVDYLDDILTRLTPPAPVRSYPLAMARTSPSTAKAADGAPYAFVSYAHKDIDLVRALLRHLQADGVRCWYDAGIEPGAHWDETLEKRIDGADLFIACVSDVYQASRWCRRELKYADLLGKSIIPVAESAWQWGEGLRMMFQELQVHRLDHPEALQRLRDRLVGVAPKVLGAHAPG